MSPELLFQLHLVLGYVAWLLCFRVYVWPRLKSMDPFEAQRAIATFRPSAVPAAKAIAAGTANRPVSTSPVPAGNAHRPGSNPSSQ